MFADVCDASVQITQQIQCTVPPNVISVIRSKSDLVLLTPSVISAHFRDNRRQKAGVNRARDVKLSLGEYKHIR